VDKTPLDREERDGGGPVEGKSRRGRVEMIQSIDSILGVIMVQKGE
jgi:hypothetical protein